MKNLFVLAYSYYEDYVPYYFEGPENVGQNEFQNLCDSLLEQAGYNALLKESSWIGWHNVVEAMVSLLEKQGYRCFKPKEVSYFGTGIIDHLDEANGLGPASEQIIEHNDKIRASIWEKHNK